MKKQFQSFDQKHYPFNAANSTRGEQPEEEPPSHHQQPVPPGSDHDHTHDEERNKDRRRVWDERHHQGRTERPK